MAIAKSGHDFVGYIRIGNDMYLDHMLQGILGPLPSSSNRFLTASFDDHVDVEAIGYTYKL